MNEKIDRMFIGALRTNKGPIHIQLGDGTGYMLPEPDKQLGFELSLAIQGFQRRREKQLKQKQDGNI